MFHIRSFRERSWKKIIFIFLILLILLTGIVSHSNDRVSPARDQLAYCLIDPMFVTSEGDLFLPEYGRRYCCSAITCIFFKKIKELKKSYSNIFCIKKQMRILILHKKIFTTTYTCRRFVRLAITPFNVPDKPWLGAPL